MRSRGASLPQAAERATALPPSYGERILPAAAVRDSDLGDLVLKPLPLLAGGRVTDASGRPVAGCEVRVASEALVRGWLEDDLSTSTAITLPSRDGTFLLALRSQPSSRALADPPAIERLHLVALHPGLVQRGGTLALQEGQTGLEVVLEAALSEELLEPEAAGRIQGRLALPEGFGRPVLRVLVEPLPPGGGEPGPGSVQMRRFRPPTFRPLEVPPGQVRVSIGISPDVRPWCTTLVTVGPGETVTLEPEQFDLRGVAVARVEFLNRSPQRILRQTPEGGWGDLGLDFASMGSRALGVPTRGQPVRLRVFWSANQVEELELPSQGPPVLVTGPEDS